MTPDPWPITHHQLLRPDPETWADVDQVERESHEAWEAAELAARARTLTARGRRRRRGLLAARLAFAVVIVLHLVAWTWGLL